LASYADCIFLDCSQAFYGPTRQAFFPLLIEKSEMVNAVALNAMVWQGTRVFGPALGGIVIGTRLGVAPGFLLAFIGFFVMSIMAYKINLYTPIKIRNGSLLKNIFEGVTFVWRNNVFRFLIGMTFFNSIFGMSYIFLLPVFAKDVFEVGPSGLGFLRAASGIGALTGTFMTSNFVWKEVIWCFAFAGWCSFWLMLDCFRCNKFYSWFHMVGFDFIVLNRNY